LVPLLAAYLLVAVAGWMLRILNLQHLSRSGGAPPPELEGAIDADRLQRSSAYALASGRHEIFESVVQSAVLGAFLFAGGLQRYDRWVASLTGSFVGAGVLFFLCLALAAAVLEIPFSLYKSFRVEARHGFNTMTHRLWAADLAKSLVLSAVLVSIVAAGALLLVQRSPHLWWLWVWGFFLGVGVLLIYLAPRVIEPLFVKVEPLRAPGLEEEIRALVARAGLRVQRVMQVDASRRSRHSNAYFTGLGRTKRIVLFDTLVARLSHPEILAVLAHEAGHWKMRHVLKRLAVTEILALAGFYLAFRALGWERLPGLVGAEQASFYARAVIVGFIGSLALFPFTGISSAWSRHDEWQADRFACDLTGSPAHLASALAGLARDNLSNLHPHPLYAKLYYSHPPVVERIRALRAAEPRPVPGLQ
jgi:STE24 endopeptidase